MRPLLLFCLLLLTFPVHAQQAAITAKYWGLKGHCDYTAFRITGRYIESTMSLDVWTRDVDPQQAPFRRWYAPLPQVPTPSVAVVNTTVYAWEPPGPPPFWGYYALYETLWAPPSGPAWIGESGTPFSVGLAPEPEITLSPVAGEILTGTTTGASFDPGSRTTFPQSVAWKYKTIGPGPNHGIWWFSQWPDQIRTVLEERPGTYGPHSGHNVYGYVFSATQGGELIDMWWAVDVEQDGTYQTGYEWQIGSCGP